MSGSKRFRNGLGVLAFSVALSACAVQHKLADELSPASVEAPAEKIPGTYVVAFVGNLDQPLKASMVVTTNLYREKASETSVYFGRPLRQTMIGAFENAFASTSLVASEGEARASVRQGVEAIIIRFTDARISGGKKQSGIGMTSEAVVNFAGEATIVRAGGKEETLPLWGLGSHTHTTYWLDQDVPPVKGATEKAITSFAKYAAATIGGALRGVRDGPQTQ